MFRPLRRFVTLALCLAASAAGAGEVRIGLANSFTGPYAASGERTRRAVELAIVTLNQAGGVQGQEVELVPADDACGTDTAAAAALALVKAGVRFVIGHRCSHSSLTAAPIYEAAAIPMMTTEFDPSHADRGGPPQRVPTDRARRRAGADRRRLARRSAAPVADRNRP